MRPQRHPRPPAQLLEPRNLDWSQPALTRTWRTVSLLCWLGGLASAFAHWPLPAAILCLLGLWAHAKRQACEP